MQKNVKNRLLTHVLRAYDATAAEAAKSEAEAGMLKELVARTPNDKAAAKAAKIAARRAELDRERLAEITAELDAVNAIPSEDISTPE